MARTTHGISRALPPKRALFWLIPVALVTLIGCSALEPRIVWAQAARHDDGPLVVVYLNNDGWGGWHGFKTPEFVLYGDGTVIYSVRTENDLRFMSTSLTSSRLDLLRSRLRISALEDADGQSYGCNCDDCTTTMLGVRKRDGALTRTCIGHVEPKPEGSDPLPRSYETVMNAVVAARGFQSPKSVEWTPTEYEIRVYNAIEGEDGVTSWPDILPPLDAIAPDRGSWYAYGSMVIPASRCRDIRSLLGPPEGAGERTKQLIRYGDRTLRVIYRPLFAYEDRWRTVK